MAEEEDNDSLSKDAEMQDVSFSEPLEVAQDAPDSDASVVGKDALLNKNEVRF